MSDPETKLLDFLLYNAKGGHVATFGKLLQVDDRSYFHLEMVKTEYDEASDKVRISFVDLNLFKTKHNFVGNW